MRDITTAQEALCPDEVILGGTLVGSGLNLIFIEKADPPLWSALFGIATGAAALGVGTAGLSSSGAPGFGEPSAAFAINNVLAGIAGIVIGVLALAFDAGVDGTINEPSPDSRASGWGVEVVSALTSRSDWPGHFPVVDTDRARLKRQP